MRDIEVPEVTGNPDDPRETFGEAVNQFMAALVAEQIPSEVTARPSFAAGEFSASVLKLLPVGQPARNFLLGDLWLITTCPGCQHEVTIVDDHVWHARSVEGVPLGHPATLGDLIDAADAHVCEAADGD